MAMPGGSRRPWWSSWSASEPGPSSSAVPHLAAAVNRPRVPRRRQVPRRRRPRSHSQRARAGRSSLAPMHSSWRRRAHRRAIRSRCESRSRSRIRWARNLTPTTLWQSDHRRFGFLTVDNVFTDPCAADPALFEPPIGPTVADVVAALTSMSSVTTADPRDVDFAGYRGSGDPVHCGRRGVVRLRLQADLGRATGPSRWRRRPRVATQRAIEAAHPRRRRRSIGRVHCGRSNGVERAAGRASGCPRLGSDRGDAHRRLRRLRLPESWFDSSGRSRSGEARRATHAQAHGPRSGGTAGWPPSPSAAGHRHHRRHRRATDRRLRRRRRPNPLGRRRQPRRRPNPRDPRPQQPRLHRAPLSR